MSTWPNNPVIYEINTWTWLDAMSRTKGKAVTLSTVKDEEWDALAALNIDAVWLMGVWERSPDGIQVAKEHPDLQAEYHKTLADFSSKDVAGSPYCVHRYTVERRLGGKKGIGIARKKLKERGLRLILDFVPNHVANDHHWIYEHPEYLIQGSDDDMAQDPVGYSKYGDRIFAHGRDPFFPAWTDTTQINAFNPGLRQAVIDLLKHVASFSDGVRCDMAMLLVSRIFQQTWGERAGPAMKKEFWVEVISAVKAEAPDFIFMAEAYWDMEWELQQQGFNYCYDKRLYDRLEHDDAEAVYQHQKAEYEYQHGLVRFIENHDEPRAAATFHAAQARTAALVMSTVPGAKLIHEGQMQGHRVKLPVQLGRRPDECTDQTLELFYATLLAEVKSPIYHDGHWVLLERQGWVDNPSYRNLVTWGWQLGKEYRVIVINLSDMESQAHIRLPWCELGDGEVRLEDIYTHKTYIRDAQAIRDPGLFVSLGPWGYHVFKMIA